jgi:hypothetical protein
MYAGRTIARLATRNSGPWCQALAAGPLNSAWNPSTTQLAPEATAAAVAAIDPRCFDAVDEDSTSPKPLIDYNHFELWYRRTNTSPIANAATIAEVDCNDEDEVHSRQDHELTSSAAVKSFDEMPGPPGLPLIGNVLAYSKLG